MLGQSLRRLLLDPEGPAVALRTEALLMAADRAEHVATVIEPALHAGTWVVSDRYTGSTIAYQGYGRGLPPDELARVAAFATGGVAADLSILVDVEVEVAAARLAAGGSTDRLERLGADFASRVREGFLTQAVADPEHWVVVDGTEDVPALTAHIVAAVHDRLGVPPATPP